MTVCRSQFYWDVRKRRTQAKILMAVLGSMGILSKVCDAIGSFKTEDILDYLMDPVHAAQFPMGRDQQHVLEALK